MKHTRRPWYVCDGVECGDPNCTGIYDERGVGVFSAVEYRTEEEARANAVLAAASPLMLEAMENLENDDGCIPSSAWELVQQAVESATGRRKP